jgi:hypothetical protein
MKSLDLNELKKQELKKLQQVNRLKQQKKMQKSYNKKQQRHIHTTKYVYKNSKPDESYNSENFVFNMFSFGTSLF